MKSNMKGKQACLAGLLAWLAIGAAPAADLDPDLALVIQQASPGDRIELIVTLRDRIDLTSISGTTRGQKRSSLVRALKKQARSSQAPLRSLLRANNASLGKELWIINSLVVTVPVQLIDRLSRMDIIESIRLNATLSGPQISPQAVNPTALATPGWNGAAINADTLWTAGFSGAGVTVAIMDTGVDVNHPDIMGAWRGGNNSWLDPHEQYSTPVDPNGHGTQVTGLIVGADAGGTTIGIAPGAQWIGVKVFDDANRTTLGDIHTGYQWLLDPDGNPNTDDAPDIINNSWTLQNIDQCDTEFSEDFDILRAADIALVFSAGNYGPGSATSVSPANDGQTLEVGAVDEMFNVAAFSSRGPSSCGGGNYPRLVAPGVNVLTSDLTFGGIFPWSYISVSGTSFSAPHVSGALALLMEVSPGSTTTALENVLIDSATDLGGVGPDNDSGWGLLNVGAAYTLIAGPTGSNPPVTIADTITTDEDVSATVNVLANDLADTSTDPANALDPTSLTILGLPSHGSVQLDTAGNISYQPAANFYGIDQLSYVVSDSAGTASAETFVNVSINPVNDAPVATADSYETIVDTMLSIVAPGVLANDTDIDGDVLTAVSLDTTATKGTVILNPDGSFAYTPVPGAVAGTADSFIYQISDGSLGSSALVTINLLSAPVSPPMAANDTPITDEDVPVLISVLGNDRADPSTALNPASVVIIGTATNGAVVSNGDGSVSYTPNANFNGLDSFRYTVSDLLGNISAPATVSVTVRPVNDRPLAGTDNYATTLGVALTVPAPGVLANDSDIDGDPLTATGLDTTLTAGQVALNPDGSFTYTPPANAVAGISDSFRYSASDGALSSASTVTITLNAPTPPPSGNTPPSAEGDELSYSRSTWGNGVMIVPYSLLLANDADEDDPSFPAGATVTVVGADAAGTAVTRLSGTVTDNGDGTLSYLPPTSGNGEDEFQYQAIDKNGGISSPAVVKLKVSN